MRRVAPSFSLTRLHYFAQTSSSSLANVATSRSLRESSAPGRDTALTFDELFALLDVDGDGLVTVPDLRAVILAPGASLTEEQIVQFLTAADLDGSGDGVSADELLEALRAEVVLMRDTDGDGRISEAELRAAAVAAGVSLTDEQVAEFMEADANGDGISVEEYLTYMSGDVDGSSWIYGEDCGDFGNSCDGATIGGGIGVIGGGIAGIGLGPLGVGVGVVGGATGGALMGTAIGSVVDVMGLTPW